jgi:hypothetical protein
MLRVRQPSVLEVSLHHSVPVHLFKEILMAMQHLKCLRLIFHTGGLYEPMVGPLMVCF